MWTRKIPGLRKPTAFRKSYYHFTLTFTFGASLMRFAVALCTITFFAVNACADAAGQGAAAPGSTRATVNAASGSASPTQARASSSPSTIQPRIVERRVIDLTQTVTFDRIPKGAGLVRLWVPIPGDAAYQRVLEQRVIEAPAGWRIEPQADGRGAFLYAELRNPTESKTRVVVESVVERAGVLFNLVEGSSGRTASAIDRRFFAEALDTDAPLMVADARVRALADEACGNERDPAQQAVMLLRKVSEVADHYSKDATKPTCGRGAASDCMDHGGGCCTDLHSLFIAMARARGIPARMQYGFRALDSREGKEFDPGYRCWVEYFVPGLGWIPTDVVASDNAGESNPAQWGSLSAGRVWLWSGRSFELVPPSSAGPIHTMTAGWAEIDGKAVDPLPAADGTPPQMTRTIQFKVLSRERDDAAPKLPE